MNSTFRWCALAVLVAGCSGVAGPETDGGVKTDSGTGDSGAPVMVTGDAGTPTRDAGTSAHDAGRPVADAGSSMASDGGLFMRPEPWTLDVSRSTKSTRSDAIIQALKDLGGWGAGALKIDFSIPVFFANSATPRRTITANIASGAYCYGGPDCEAVPLQMPVPVIANIEGSSNFNCDTSYNTVGQGDCHLLVVEQSEKKLYELYNATETGNATGLVALGAFVWDLTKAYPDNARGDQCTSADAAGFPIAGLLPTADEVASGEVRHAIRFILPNYRMKAGVYVHPGSHSGAPSATNPNAPPYAVRFRLKSTYSEAGFSPGEVIVLRALKTYGMLLSDGGSIAFTFADDRTSSAKWADQGIDANSFSAIPPDAFEVVELGAEIARRGDCVRN